MDKINHVFIYFLHQTIKILCKLLQFQGKAVYNIDCGEKCSILQFLSDGGISFTGVVIITVNTATDIYLWGKWGEN